MYVRVYVYTFLDKGFWKSFFKKLSSAYSIFYQHTYSQEHFVFSKTLVVLGNLLL